MEITFSKYQGTGNDFVMLDNLTGKYDSLTLDQIRYLCNRKLGVGADGLIKISKDVHLDFNVEYFNSDGSQSFCGNGARCSVAFAKTLGLLDETTRFNAIDGAHEAKITVDGRVHLEMIRVKNADIEHVEMEANDVYIMDTGSPHYLKFVKAEDAPNIVSFGKEIRYSDRFKEEGINVNTVVELGPNTIHVATYERGVEDETLSCGTGVTACALAYMSKYENDNEVSVSTKGGKLSVKAKTSNNGFEEIWLIGPAKKVFDGSIEI
ncbi:MAG: diaminopimelate epimerase [bacterium]|nr:diaminopimelate epimerase [bacterium]